MLQENNKEKPKPTQKKSSDRKWVKTDGRGYQTKTRED